MNKVEITPDAIVVEITEQRNSALNNLAVAKATIKALQAKLEEQATKEEE